MCRLDPKGIKILLKSTFTSLESLHENRDVVIVDKKKDCTIYLELLHVIWIVEKTKILHKPQYSKYSKRYQSLFLWWKHVLVALGFMLIWLSAC